MSKSVRLVIAVLVGLFVWVAVATLGNLILRAAIPDYRAEEVAMSFSFVAQLSRLALGLASTVVAAVTAVVLNRGGTVAAVVVGLIFFLLFLPLHISIWSKFPAWYHVFFLAPLPLGAWLTGRMVAFRREMHGFPRRCGNFFGMSSVSWLSASNDS